ncbi:hypothetical protein FRC02_011112 [Tulasnella sp. 418]|nr:hypothetical protein FRC02_011112 [Tulasnella sp. 418]
MITITQDAANTATYQNLSTNSLAATIFTSKDVNHPMVAAFFRMQQGETLRWTYPGNEFCLILEGELHMRDTENPDQIHRLKAGDVARADKGTVATFSTPSHAKGFVVSQLSAENLDMGSLSQVADL